MDLGALQKADLLRQLTRQDERIRKLESILQGQPLKGVKIDQLSWNQARGGSAVFGGQNNVAGLIEVRDENNNQAIILNKDGIVIYNGKMIIKNQDGSTVIDRYGLVSSSNFNNGTNSAIGVGQSITSLSYTDLVGSAIPFTLPRSALVFVIATIQFYMSQSSGGNPWTVDGQVSIDMDGSSHGLSIHFGTEVTSGGIPSGAIRLSTSTTHSLSAYDAGDHVAKLKGFLTSTTNNGYLYLYSYHISVIILGT